MKKLPAFMFYPSDWRSDPGIQSLDYETRGIWFEMLCLMHESSDRGKLILAGRAMTEDELAQILGLPASKVNQALSKLSSKGVASTDKESGAICNRRMVRDNQLRMHRARAGSLGGKQRSSNCPSKPESKGPVSVSVSVSEKPPTPFQASNLTTAEAHDLSSAQACDLAFDPVIKDIKAAWARHNPKQVVWDVSCQRGAVELGGMIRRGEVTLDKAAAAMRRFFKLQKVRTDYQTWGMIGFVRNLSAFMDDKPPSEPKAKRKPVDAPRQLPTKPELEAIAAKGGAIGAEAARQIKAGTFRKGE